MVKRAFKNAFLNGETLVTCTTTDSRVCLSLTLLAPKNSLIILRTFTSLVASKEVDIEDVFSSIPINVNAVVGPKVLSRESSTPSSSHVATVMANAR